MILGSTMRAVRSRRSGLLVALMALSLPNPATAGSVSNDALRGVLGPSSLRLIGAARVAAGFGTVTSGFRSIAHNRRVGGVPTSYHLVGRALDVERRPGVSHQMIASALHRAGFVLVESLDERDHSHFAFASAMPLAAVGTSRNNVAEIQPSKPSGPRVLADDHGVLLAVSPPLAIAK